MKYFLIICLLLLTSQNALAQMYTIIDDDIASLEAISTIKNLADKKGIKIVFGAVSGVLLKNKEVTQALLEYQKEGFQICDHSYSHSRELWTKGSWPQIEEEIKKSRIILDTLGFVHSDYLILPFGKFSENQRHELITHLPSYYKLAFNSRGHFCDLNDFNRMYINRFPVRKHNQLDVVKYRIDQAIEKKGWIVFLTHSHNKRDFDANYLEKIIDYCQSKNLKAYTLTEAYSIIEKNEGKAETKDNTFIQEVLDFLLLHWAWVTCLFVFFAGVVLVIIRWLACKKRPLRTSIQNRTSI